MEKPADHNWLNTATTGVDDYGLYTTLSLFGLEQRMRWIPSGRFVMGSPEEELERESNETQHPVVLTEGFWLADTTCTQQLWKAVTGMNPSRFEGARNPVERVSWGDVQYFIDKINKQHPELRLSLPTEAQWEYACRAGTTGPFSTGATITTGQANFNGKRSYANTEKGEYRRKTIPVDALAPNPWGMLQMHGNVFEWCQDWYGKYPEGEVINPTGTKDGAGRVLRGGSWFYGGRGCRSAFRTPLEPVRRSDDVGFRLSQAGFVSSNSKQ
ncbi:hypothetical protein AB833_03100 [Chromatiales bacterium (ex Bugula neritina AB1)]|nr:hypothetical protein AB833_03100 [Chromatiales bacterium (ex Bugula neritina AB1)]